MRYILVSILLLTGSNSYSDELHEGIKYLCKGNRLEIEQINLWNDEKPQLRENEKAFFDKEQHNLECKIGKNTAKISFINREPKEKGMCGAAPGSYITISLNNDLIIQDAYIGNECLESLHKVKLEESRWVGMVLEICGHNSNGANPHFSGCLEYKKGMYKKLPLPLELYPISNLIDNKSFKKDAQKRRAF